MIAKNSFVFTICLAVVLGFVVCQSDENDEDPYTTTDPKKREPSPCEICKFFVNEFVSRLDESSKSKEVIETGHNLEKRKRFKYLTSELRLTEALHEPHICEKILDYNVHAERKGSLRYAKGMSETMQTLHGLVNKGVKVELGIPYELWDKPSAEVSKMHRACFTFAEQYEEVIEDWYFNRQHERDLMRYLCADRFLYGKDQKCLDEVFKPKGDSGKSAELEDKGEVEVKKSKPKKKKTKPSSDIPSGNQETVKNDIEVDNNDNSAQPKGEAGDFVTPKPGRDPLEIPKPTHTPMTTPLPKTSRNEGDL